MKYFDHRISFYLVFKEQLQDGEDFSEHHFDLENTNPADTMSVAIFKNKDRIHARRGEKLEYFYTCKFRYFTKIGCLLFSIDKDEKWDLWKRHPWYACYDTNSPNRAARWMLEKVNKENVDYFSKGSWFTNC